MQQREVRCSPGSRQMRTFSRFALVVTYAQVMADPEPAATTPEPVRDVEYWKKQERRSWIEMLLGLGFGRVRYPDTPKPRGDTRDD